jgi:hypothetical protein
LQTRISQKFADLHLHCAEEFVDLQILKKHLGARLCKFSTSVNDTGSKFAAGVNDISGNLPLVSMTPVVNLPRCQRQWWCTLSCEYFRKFFKIFEVENLMALSLESFFCAQKIVHSESHRSRGTVPLNILLHLQNCT